jgi:hypothetical protein
MEYGPETQKRKGVRLFMAIVDEFAKSPRETAPVWRTLRDKEIVPSDPYIVGLLAYVVERGAADLRGLVNTIETRRPASKAELMSEWDVPFTDETIVKFNRV